jgi:hypothetical protein
MAWHASGNEWRIMGSRHEGRLEIVQHAVVDNKQRVDLLFWAGRRGNNSSQEKTNILQNAAQHLRLGWIPQDRAQWRDHMNMAVNLWVS